MCYDCFHTVCKEDSSVWMYHLSDSEFEEEEDKIDAPTDGPEDQINIPLTKSELDQLGSFKVVSIPKNRVRLF